MFPFSGKKSNQVANDQLTPKATFYNKLGGGGSVHQIYHFFQRRYPFLWNNDARRSYINDDRPSNEDSRSFIHNARSINDDTRSSFKDDR